MARKKVQQIKEVAKTGDNPPEAKKSKYMNSFGSRKTFWLIAGYAGLGLILGEAIIMVVQYLITWLTGIPVVTPPPVFTPEIRYGILGLFTSAGAIYGAARGMPGSSEYSHPSMPDRTTGRVLPELEDYSSKSPDA